jgi:hypothetical protein
LLPVEVLVTTVVMTEESCGFQVMSSATNPLGLKYSSFVLSRKAFVFVQLCISDAASATISVAIEIASEMGWGRLCAASEARLMAWSHRLGSTALFSLSMKSRDVGWSIPATFEERGVGSDEPASSSLRRRRWVMRAARGARRG